ncbi:hypothetical protein GGS20DRAFT_540981 [Poronia punctata]|nr:hypothetical protein GGS20DRAFT_540981 [Poronia punctata]
MSPRKRSKPNPSEDSATDPGVASQLANTPSPVDMPTKPGNLNTSTSTAARNDKSVRKSQSWYGSWPRVSKSTASTQVARENIMGNTRRTEGAADFSRFERKTTDSTDSDTQSRKTLHSITEANAGEQDVSTPSMTQTDTDMTSNAAEHNPEIKEADAPDDNVPETLPPTEESRQEPSSSTSWLSWLSGSAVQSQTQAGTETPEVQPKQEETPTTEPPQPQESPVQSPVQTTQPPSETAKPATSATSWFGFWSTPSNPAPQPSEAQENTSEDTEVEEPRPSEGEDVPMKDTPPVPTPTPATSQPSVGSTWAFWSRDTASRKPEGEPSVPEQGELAVIGDGSETSPKKSNVQVRGDDQDEAKSETKSTKERLLSKAITSKKGKRSRPLSTNLDDPSTSRPSTPTSDVATKIAPQKAASASGSKAPSRNLLLPSFKSTYRMKENPSIIKQIAQLLLRAQQPPTNHVFLSKETPKVKKAIAIGVHGLFPASYLRPMIGQPTGTSIRFANHCAEAIRRWTESNGSSGCEIQKIALEGDGKIAERVDNLWKLLLNWIDQIKNADLIVFACHSQGVPVGIMLLAKLIDLGILTHSRIGVCAMAGVSLGPFPDYKSGMGILMGSAAELWQFGNPDSAVSKRYENALKTVIDYGGRITYIGSIDDQLVPMESATYGPVSHPYIYRAVFIDGRVHAPDFLAHLVGFALKLRNLGISDHGLIRELSVPLAGSLYSGEGHSRLYDDDQVYDLALSHTLETTSASKVPCRFESHQGLTNPNPYVLPWIMRGLLEEQFVKTELYSETVELLRQFDDWTPTTKPLKDVKYRLEAVRSKL